SGKLDRRALPEPEPAAGPESAYVPPRTGTERTLAEIWAEVLGVERVGVEDNFFGLGGDSILSIQVVSRARRAGLPLATRDIFLHQTVAELAPVVDGARVPEPAAAALMPGPTGLSPIQHWFFATHGPLRHFTMSMLVDVAEDVDEAALRTAVAAVVGRRVAAGRDAAGGGSGVPHPRTVHCGRGTRGGGEGPGGPRPAGRTGVRSRAVPVRAGTPAVAVPRRAPSRGRRRVVADPA
ncbi:MAG: hypothetical protein DMF84_01275, partial [Acidobacteria bacterium]